MFESSLTLRRLALVGMVGPVVWWLLIIINGAITPGYSHVSDFMSTLGGVGAPYAIIQRVNFAVLGGSILTLGLGLHRWFGDGRRPKVGTLLLGVFGIGVILAGVFPENTADPDSLTNVLHDVTGIIGFLGGIVGIALVSRRTSVDDRWPSYRFEAIGTVVIVVGTFVIFIQSGEALVGLYQRLFIGVVTAWVVMQSYRLYRLVEAPAAGEAEAERPDAARPS